MLYVCDKSDKWSSDTSQWFNNTNTQIRSKFASVSLPQSAQDQEHWWMVAQTVHPPRPVARIIPVPGATAPASVLSLATRTFTYSREYVRVPLYTYSSRYYMHVGRFCVVGRASDVTRMQANEVLSATVNALTLTLTDSRHLPNINAGCVKIHGGQTCSRLRNSKHIQVYDLFYNSKSIDLQTNNTLRSYLQITHLAYK